MLNSKSRKEGYDAESDILYLVIKEGEIKDTVEVSEDMFIEYDENDKIHIFLDMAPDRIYKIRRIRF